ncbi:hypothetical protein [Pedobacter sp. UBA5917]|jgi:hypothetical protein|uniref:hypothetical protein n=1 Tax=Pedobacter sp. UBA5917 TaxID=1947061 RepID=UPI0025F1B66E|nr:hypothetical protein [Pedobacter sp. UBA5917]
MKFILTLVLLTTISLAGFSQETKKAIIENRIQDTKYAYAYILIQGKFLSKRLKVDVDLGDSPEQVKEGRQYSEMLTNKKSYAAILNYMVENQYELVQTLDYTDTYSGSGGTSGIVFIMRRKV